MVNGPRLCRRRAAESYIQSFHDAGIVHQRLTRRTPLRLVSDTAAVQSPIRVAPIIQQGIAPLGDESLAPKICAIIESG